MTKRIISLVLVLCLAFSLVACGGEAAQPSGPKDYTAILSAARPQEQNDNLVIFTYKDGAFTASGAYAADLSAEDVDTLAGQSMLMLGIDPTDVTEAVFSVNAIAVTAYGMAIVKPAEGKADVITEGLQAFIEGQKAAQQNYLPDQYEIAKSAKLETMKTGEVVLVMCEDQNTVFGSIKDALK